MFPLSLIHCILIYFYLEVVRYFTTASYKLTRYSFLHDGKFTCQHLCHDGYDGKTPVNSKCIDALLNNITYGCHYRRRPRTFVDKTTDELQKLPKITCICEESLSYESIALPQFTGTEYRPNNVFVVVESGYQYATLDDVAFELTYVDHDVSPCQNYTRRIWNDWEVAPANQETLSIIEKYPFSGTQCIILSDNNAYRTRLGRTELFNMKLMSMQKKLGITNDNKATPAPTTHAEKVLQEALNEGAKNSLIPIIWFPIEGRIVGENDLEMTTQQQKLTMHDLSECKSLCSVNDLCKAIQFPYCQLKSSSVADALDISYEYTTYIKLTRENSAGFPLYCNDKNKPINYVVGSDGELAVPIEICPGRILLRKKREIKFCEENGHYYEKIDLLPSTYPEAVELTSHYRSKLFFNGKRGRLAVVTSKEENECVRKLCDDEQSISWVAGESRGSLHPGSQEWLWRLDDSYLKFVDAVGIGVLPLISPAVFIEPDQTFRVGNEYFWKQNQDLRRSPNTSAIDFALTVCETQTDENSLGWGIHEMTEEFSYIIEYERK